MAIIFSTEAMIRDCSIMVKSSNSTVRIRPIEEAFGPFLRYGAIDLNIHYLNVENNGSITFHYSESDVVNDGREFHEVYIETSEGMTVSIPRGYKLVYKQDINDSNYIFVVKAGQ